MAKNPPPPAARAAPWWLVGGTEECPHCGQAYHLEHERRCSGCDAPGCPHCLNRHESGHICPDCTPESQP